MAVAAGVDRALSVCERFVGCVVWEASKISDERGVGERRAAQRDRCFSATLATPRDVQDEARLLASLSVCQSFFKDQAATTPATTRMAKTMMVVHLVAEPDVPAARVQWRESVE